MLKHAIQSLITVSRTIIVTNTFLVVSFAPFLTDNTAYS